MSKDHPYNKPEVSKFVRLNPATYLGVGDFNETFQYSKSYLSTEDWDLLYHQKKLHPGEEYRFYSNIGLDAKDAAQRCEFLTSIGYIRIETALTMEGAVQPNAVCFFRHKDAPLP